MNGVNQSHHTGNIGLTSLVVLTFLGLVTLAAFWYPVKRITQYEDINYNEGWNTYRADMAARGQPLYGLPPKFTLTNYPPLSFHLVGSLGKFTGGYNAAGRWIALVSLAILAIVMGALVRQYTDRWRLGIYAILLFGMGLAVVLPDRIGANDPEWLSLALSFTGFYVYVRNQRSNWFLCASALAFSVSLFTKHNFLALPGAVGLHLILQRAWRPLAVWLGALGLASSALLLLTIQWDGPYFFSHLLAPRGYNLGPGWHLIVAHVVTFQIPIAAAALWSACYATQPKRNLLVIAFVLAHVVGFVFSGGDGVDENILLDALAIAAVITAIGIGDLEEKLIAFRFSTLSRLLVLIAPFLGSLTLLPTAFLIARHTNKLGPNLDGEFRRAVEFLQNRPGPAICEDLLLCYDAGKPPLYDTYFATDQLSIGRLSESEVVNYIQTSRFPTIEITIPAEQPLVPVARRRFSEPVLRAILERYRPAVRSSEFALLVPKDEPER
jgi:hypothetical protein